VNWARVPKDAEKGTVRITRAGLESVEIDIPIFQATPVARDTLDGFVEGEGYVSIEAEHFTKNVPAERTRWEKIEEYGRTLSAMTIMPVTAASVNPPENSPCLEYKMYLFTTGQASVLATFAPTLNFNPDRGLRYAVSFDNEKPQIMDIVPQGFDARNGNREWEESVRNSARTIRSEHELVKPGYHTLKIWMVDPAVVLEKIVVDLGGAKPSYLGPPESYFRINGE
ncbi:MAG: glycosyl hydrolase, partial [Acidobacteria bacterium]|nr:glycosyl hydrolase [Acidobacteriota bacterium]